MCVSVCVIVCVWGVCVCGCVCVRVFALHEGIWCLRVRVHVYACMRVCVRVWDDYG